MATRHKGTRPKKLVVLQERGDIESFGPIGGPEDVVAAMDTFIGARAYEVFVAIYLDAQNRPVAYNEYTDGAMAHVSVELSGMLRDALLSGSLGVITVHQHPSGGASPSDADRNLWRAIDRGMDAIGLKALDHLVVARPEAGIVEFFSTREGRARPWRRP